MFCTECTRFERCEIMIELLKLKEKLESIKQGNTLITKLSVDPKQSLEYARNEYKKLRLERGKWTRKQLKCLRRRGFLHSIGYQCFRD